MKTQNINGVQMRRINGATFEREVNGDLYRVESLTKYYGFPHFKLSKNGQGVAAFSRRYDAISEIALKIAEKPAEINTKELLAKADYALELVQAMTKRG